MATNTFTFDKVTLVRENGGTDRLSFQCSNAESPFPELAAQFPGEYPLIIRIECRKGYAEEWCQKMGIVIDSKVIVDTSVRSGNRRCSNCCYQHEDALVKLCGTCDPETLSNWHP